MILFLWLAIFGMARAFAQQSYDDGPDYSPLSRSFHYYGCAAVNMSAFGPAIVFPHGGLTHETCQTACTGNRFAAIFPGACRCGNDASAVTPLDESACNYPCNQNPDSEMCGGICPDHVRDISAVFTTDPWVPVSSSAPPPATVASDAPPIDPPSLPPGSSSDTDPTPTQPPRSSPATETGPPVSVSSHFPPVSSVDPGVSSVIPLPSLRSTLTKPHISTLSVPTTTDEVVESSALPVSTTLSRPSVVSAPVEDFTVPVQVPESGASQVLTFFLATMGELLLVITLVF